MLSLSSLKARICSLDKACMCVCRQCNFTDRDLNLMLMNKLAWPITYVHISALSTPGIAPTLWKKQSNICFHFKDELLKLLTCTCLSSPPTTPSKASQSSNTKYVEKILRLVDRNTGRGEPLYQRRAFPLHIQNTGIFSKNSKDTASGECRPSSLPEL